MRATTKKKTFDCVEMKNHIQARIMAEYEAHKGEFASFLDFVRARNRKSGWVQRMEARFSPRKTRREPLSHRRDQ